MLYNLAISVYTLAVKIAAIFNTKAALMCKGQKETFDILRENRHANDQYIWIHAASLGEFEQGRPIIERLRKEKGQYKILLTFFSPSGYEIRKNYSGADLICYLPFDQPALVQQFLDIAQPSMAIFIKYEFWRNYLALLAQRNIPIFLVSAIFRPQQIFFKPYGKQFREILKCFSHIFVQDEDSKTLLSNIGIKKVSIAGDTRFDRVIEIVNQVQEIPKLSEWNKENCKIIVAGSTWQADEDILLPIIDQRLEEVKLIIAPHEIHQAHLQSIEAKLTQRSTVRLSKASKEEINNAHCIIIDSIGLLSSIYRYANIAYIGGGFGAGIHNTLEAAVYGLPIIFGTRYSKFKEARDLIAKGAAHSIDNAQQLEQHIEDLLAYDSLRKDAAQAAQEYVKQQAGATDIIINHICKQIT